MSTDDDHDLQQPSTSAMERDTICFPQYGTREVMRRGDANFHATLNELYQTPENNALEALIQLKTRLRNVENGEFFSVLTEGVSHILDAEMSFVMKRMLVDDQDSAVEMPPYGEPGSCMMAAAFHYCARDGSKFTLKETKFYAYGCPCAYMRHDKVFLIPDHLNEFITDNPNKLPTPAEAYIAVPLVAEGKHFAHFGVIWSKESAANRKLSWAFIELLLHSLEDMVQDALVKGSNFVRPTPAIAEQPREQQRIIPHDAVTVAQSLRPYAGSLSHELRTPMQGIVGMLDVMYATVREAVDTQNDPHLRGIFQNLRENIEIVQDSSRRAVEAADNVVHAYDMDMSVPEAPAHLSFDDNDTGSPFSAGPIDKRPEILVAGHNLPLSRPNKRRRDEAYSRHGSDSSASNNKFQRIEGASAAWSRRSEPSLEILEGIQEAERIDAHSQTGATVADLPSAEDAELAEGAVTHQPTRIIAPGLRHTNMREVFRHVIDEGLKVGGRPDQFLATETTLGESISVRSRGSDGTTKTKTIDWRVDPNVPHSMFIDEKDLSKLLSCVFRNAIKFTDQDGGRVGIFARMSSRSRYISIKMVDNGPGIPAAFLPKLFKAFSRDDYSTTRQSEGLGLGLMVAKGLARKLGGDLICVRSETEGPNHGSEFEIKVPVRAGETITRPSSPYSSPRLGQARPSLTHHQSYSQQMPPPPFHPPSSPPKDTNEKQVAIKEPLSISNLPSTPPSPSSPAEAALPEPNLPLEPSSPSRKTTLAPPPTPGSEVATATGAPIRPRIRKSVSNPEIDHNLAVKYPLTFLVAEDNKINRKLLVSMLRKFGYTAIHEAHDGAEAVRQMAIPRPAADQIDVILMDLWMPFMDGYEATERILGTGRGSESAAAGTGGSAGGATVAEEAQSPLGTKADSAASFPPATPVTAVAAAGYTPVQPEEADKAAVQTETSQSSSATTTTKQNGLQPPSPSSQSTATPQDERPALRAANTFPPPTVQSIINKPLPTVLAVTADSTDGALERAARVGMRGFMTKPYKLHDLQRLITEYCARNGGVAVPGDA